MFGSRSPYIMAQSGVGVREEVDISRDYSILEIDLVLRYRSGECTGINGLSIATTCCIHYHCSIGGQRNLLIGA